MVFLFCAVFFKMFSVMIASGEKLQVKAMSQWLRDVPTDAPRGNILDRNGKVLASTATRYNLYVRPGDASDQGRGCKASLRRVRLRFRLDLFKDFKKGERSDGCNARNQRATQQDIRCGVNDGIYYAEDNLRYYPYGDFMTQLSDFCSSGRLRTNGWKPITNKYLTG